MLVVTISMQENDCKMIRAALCLFGCLVSLIIKYTSHNLRLFSLAATTPWLKQQTCFFFSSVHMIQCTWTTLTDHSSIIRRSTAASVYEVAMRTAEQVCFSTSTLEITHSRRLGGVAECTTCYSNSTCVRVCVYVCMCVCVFESLPVKEGVRELVIAIAPVYVCVCVCVYVCVCVFESLPVKEGGRKLVLCTLSPWKKFVNFSLLFFFGGTCLCVLYYVEYYPTDLCGA